MSQTAPLPGECTPDKSRPTSPQPGAKKPADELRISSNLRLKIEYASPETLTGPERGARSHSPRQINDIASSILDVGFLIPLVVDSQGRVITGRARLAAAKLLKLAEVPVIRIDHLSEAERRAFAIADNRLAEKATWDEEFLAIEMNEILILDPEYDLEKTGFDTPQIDHFLGLEIAPGIDPKADNHPAVEETAISRLDDIWVADDHLVACGDARDEAIYTVLMGAEKARAAITDPPFNAKIVGNVGGKGKAVRREFVMASGEMAPNKFVTFLTDFCQSTAKFCADGALVYAFMDWRGMGAMLAAGFAAFTEMKNLLIWTKTNAGMGSCYRSQHELIFLFKVGTAPHLLTFGLGASGRYRTNVLSYAGLNAFGAGRDEDLAMHPTVKPTALVADLIKDCTRRGDIVLDPFGGSGTTLIAAQKVGRRARLIELDPLYVDCILRRWIQFTGRQPVLRGSGMTFDDVARLRASEALEAAQ